MSQTIIFCASYGEIKRTLYLATRQQACPVTVVLPGMHDLYRLFQELNQKALNNSLNLIYFEPYPSRRVKAKGINKAFQVLPDIIRERRYLKEIYRRYFADLEDYEVFFHNRGFNGYLFYLVSKLGQKNRVVNTSPTPPQMEPIRKYTPGNVSGLASLMILKLIYGFDIAMGRLPNVRGFIYMTDRFIEKTVAQVISWEEIEELMKDFDYGRYRVFDTGKYRVIYFDNSLMETGYVSNRDIYQQEMTGIFNILARHFPENEIARKYHPSYPDDKTLIKCGDVLPDFIPAELLYDEKVKIYLGFFSYSIANVEKDNVISLMDLVTFKDETMKNILKNNLKQMSRSKVLFPASLEDFERIIIDLKK